jgi:crotonobetainyl-CoA:carnitine CoA-transferase CaiB-like acyl-CoA transferase
MSEGPLAGYRVVELATMITGPLAAMQLGDMGAEVIKVEPPGVGDVMRYTGTSSGGMSALFATCNRSKRAIVLDLKTAWGVDTMLRLLDTADVFITNTRPGVTDRLGIGEPVVQARNPGIVYVSLSGFGTTGPYKDRPAYDNVVQAYSGAPIVQHDYLTGQPEPIRTFLADKITSYTAVQGVLAALLARERGHGGQHIELNMLDAMFAFLWPDGYGDHTWLGDSEHPLQVLPELQRAFDVFATKDGYLTLTAILQEQWEGLAKACEQPDWVTDPRFGDAISRLMNVDEIIGDIREVLATRTSEDWLERFVANGVPCAPIADLDTALANPQVQANGIVQRSEHPHGGPMQQAGPPTTLPATPQAISRPAPLLGEHTEEILAELGISAAPPS